MCLHLLLLAAALIPVNTEGQNGNLYFHNSNFTADLKYLIYSHDGQIYKPKSGSWVEGRGWEVLETMEDERQRREQRGSPAG